MTVQITVVPMGATTIKPQTICFAFHPWRRQKQRSTTKPSANTYLYQNGENEMSNDLFMLVVYIGAFLSGLFFISMVVMLLMVIIPHKFPGANLSMWIEKNLLDEDPEQSGKYGNAKVGDCITIKHDWSSYEDSYTDIQSLASAVHKESRK